MDPFEKFQRLFRAKMAFPTTNSPLFESLRNELPLTPHEQARAERGLSTEGRFAEVFSALPWAAMIHELGQRQLPPASKQFLQVPDYLAIIKPTGIHAESAVLVETKLVSGEKITLRLQDVQLTALEAYANIVGIPLVIGIFWERGHVWTIHTPDQFARRGKVAKIGQDRAFRHDLSIIFSESLVDIGAGWQRRTTYDPTAEGFHVRDPVRGYIVNDYLATTADKYVQLSEVESGIIDVMTPFTTVETYKVGQRQVVIAETPAPRVTKTSMIIEFVLERFDVFGEDSEPKKAFNTFVKLKVDAEVPTRPLLPEQTTVQVSRLFKQVFGFEWEDTE